MPIVAHELPDSPLVSGTLDGLNVVRRWILYQSPTAQMFGDVAYNANVAGGPDQFGGEFLGLPVIRRSNSFVDRVAQIVEVEYGIAPGGGGGGGVPDGRVHFSSHVISITKYWNDEGANEAIGEDGAGVPGFDCETEVSWTVRGVHTLTNRNKWARAVGKVNNAGVGNFQPRTLLCLGVDAVPAVGAGPSDWDVTPRCLLKGFASPDTGHRHVWYERKDDRSRGLKHEAKIYGEISFSATGNIPIPSGS